MSAEKGQIVSQVKTGSLANELGIQPGDRLISINDQPVLDVFDYHMRQLSDELLLLIEKSDGSRVEFDLEKDEDEDLGLIFDNPLLDDCSSCHNNCIFCFIDQLPAGMRKTLYFKDDDMRMSFLHGNYVTLTNIDDDELDRLIAYRFSPMNISVHATDPVVRMRMMRNKHAGELYPRLQKLSKAGISLNCQLVLVPGINDGEVLEKTLSDLIALGDNVISIAMVPVGVTRYRDENGLFPLRVFTQTEAELVVDTIERWQNKMMTERGRRIVFAGDEFYLRAQRSLPAAKTYEDYPQLENGVGMAALFLDTISSFLSGEPISKDITGYNEVKPSYINETDNGSKETGRPSIVIATGALAADIIKPFIPSLARNFELDISLNKIDNDFFGHTVSVAGLITGQDLKEQMKKWIMEHNVNPANTIILIPDCMLKADEDIFLDNVSLRQISESLNCRVIAVPEQAEGLLNTLAALNER